MLLHVLHACLTEHLQLVWPTDQYCVQLTLCICRSLPSLTGGFGIQQVLPRCAKPGWKTTMHGQLAPSMLISNPIDTVIDTSASAVVADASSVNFEVGDSLTHRLMFVPEGRVAQNSLCLGPFMAIHANGICCDSLQI